MMCLGLATGYIKHKEERTTSLLKPYTNNDKLNDMSLEERADFLGKAPWCNQNCSYDDSCNNCFEPDFCRGQCGFATNPLTRPPQSWYYVEV